MTRGLTQGSATLTGKQDLSINSSEEKKKKKKEHASSCKTRRGIARVSTLVTGRREDLQLGGRRQEKGIKGGFVEKVPFLLGLAVKIDNK